MSHDNIAPADLVALDKRHVKAAAAVLTRAFQDDPLFGHTFSDQSEMKRKAPSPLFECDLGYGVRGRRGRRRCQDFLDCCDCICRRGYFCRRRFYGLCRAFLSRRRLDRHRGFCCGRLRCCQLLSFDRGYSVDDLVQKID